MPSKKERDAMLNALKKLGETKFSEFCDELAKPEGEPRIWPSEVEKMKEKSNGRNDVVKLVVSRCSSKAVDRVITTLRDIGCNDEAEALAEEADVSPPKRDISRLRTPPPGFSPPAQETAGSSTSTDIYPVTPNSIENRVALLITVVKNRSGAEKDEENMKKLLSALRYEVVKYRDLTAKEMNDALVEFSKHPKLKKTDSVFVAIMSHGKLGVICGVNHTRNNPDELKVDDIYKKLNAENCPELVDKPKIIIIQACRGKETGSFELKDDEDADGDEEDASRFTHKEKDFITLFSSTPHTYSWRNPLLGAYLIRFTVDVFKTNVLKDHIEKLFQKVMKEFAERKELPDRKQMPTKDGCTLIRDFFLFPGDLKQHYRPDQLDENPGPSATSLNVMKK